MSTTSTRKVVAGAVAAVALGVGALAVAAGAGEASSDDPSTTTASTTAATSDATTTTDGPSSTDVPGPTEATGPTESSGDGATTTAPLPAADPAHPADPDQGGGPHPGGPGFLDDVLDGLVADGTLTQDQADAVRDGVAGAAERWRADHPRPEGGPGGPRGWGPGRGLPHLEEAVAAAAEIIGVEPDALRDGLRDGRSVAEIAEEAGVARQDVVDAIVAAATDALDQAVADGHLDTDRAASLAEHLPEWAGQLVDAHRPR